MSRFAANLLMLSLALWGAWAPCAMAKPVIFHRAPADVPDDENSLRPADVFGPIPSEATAAGFAPNDLTTSVRTDVTPATRGGVETISAGTYSSPYTTTTANRTIRLLGDVTFEGCGIRISHSNITVDLNGYTLTYNNVAPTGVETGTVSSSGGGGGSSNPTLDPSGISLSTNARTYSIVEFTSGSESGNCYEVVSNTTSTLTMENDNEVSDEIAYARSWQDGGPSPGDTFRIYNPEQTGGVIGYGYPGGTIEVVNGSIVQGAGYGRGINYHYSTGLAPIQYLDGGTPWVIGGVSATWASANTCGFVVSGSTGATIKYCELTDNGTLITDRQRGASNIRTGANATVQYNRIINHRQGAIGTGAGGVVEYNEIYGDSRATNSTGAGTFSLDNVTIRYNNFYKVGQHPVCIGVAEESNNTQVYGNWCEAKTTRTSPEYGVNYACGFSNRWGTRETQNHYYENCFITYAHTVGGTAYPSRTMLTGGEAVDYNELVEDSFFGAYSNDGTECHCVGMGSEGYTVQNCTLVSTCNIYWLADHYWYPENYPRFIQNTTIQSGSDPAFSTFLTDDYLTQEVDFIAGIYGTGTAADDFSGSPGSLVKLRFGYMLTVTVTDAGSPVSGATVVVKDKDGNTLRSGYTTNGSGQVVVDVPTYYRQGPGFSVTALTPLTVEAVKAAKDGTNTTSPSADASVTVTIE